MSVILHGVARRSRVRTEELGGINKAVEILSSDSAKGTFAASGSTFIQVPRAGSSVGVREAEI